MGKEVKLLENHPYLTTYLSYDTVFLRLTVTLLINTIEYLTIDRKVSILKCFQSVNTTEQRALTAS